MSINLLGDWLMLYAIQDHHGRLLLGMHSTKPVVPNFGRKWSTVRLFLIFLQFVFLQKSVIF